MISKIQSSKCPADFEISRSLNFLTENQEGQQEESIWS